LCGAFFCGKINLLLKLVWGYMEQELLKKIEEQGEKIEKVYRSVGKMRKFFLWTLIITGALVVLPLIGLLFAIPDFLSLYGDLGL